MERLITALKRRFSGLSNQLITTITCVILFVTVVAYLPAVASYRTTWLEDRVRIGVTATRVLDAVPDVMALPRELTDRLLDSAGAIAIVYRREGHSQLIEHAEPIDVRNVVVADLRNTGMLQSIIGALDTMFSSGGRTLRVIGDADEGDSLVELLMYERPLQRDLVDFSRSIALISAGIAAVTAFVLYLLVSQLFLAPVYRLTNNVLRFRQAPENAALILQPTKRKDEIGILARELSAMESEIFSMLRQRRHLADLGLAVAKINHDLRNTLASAQLLSDQVATLDDPKVQRLAPRLVTTLDKAIGFAQSVLDYGRQAEAVPNFEPAKLRPLAEEAAFEARLVNHPNITFINAVPDGLSVTVDRGQFSRVLVNLLKNAREALEVHAAAAPDNQVEVDARVVGAHVIVSVADNGPGLPERAKNNLFVPFKGSARAGGTGLGLAIAREITEAHGGRLTLGNALIGTRFDVAIPIHPQAV